MSAVYLCGFMGCGKSTVGEILSSLLGCEFLDLDTFIEDNEKASISEIFKASGEAGFRSLETKYLKILAEKTAVVATGGGALISEENAQAARKSGVVIFIDTSFEQCYLRIKNESHRPIVNSKSKDELEQLYNFRTPVYKSHCDFEVNGDSPPHEIALSIQKTLQSL